MPTANFFAGIAYMFAKAFTRFMIGASFLLILCILSCASCSAVPLHVNFGFDGAAKSLLWTPITVQISNPTDENIEGILVIQPDNDKPFLAKCAAKVMLPAHSKKLYHAYIRLSDFGSILTVSLVRGSGIYGTKRIKIDPCSRDDKLVVSVGRRAARLNFLNGETVPASQQRSSTLGYASSPGAAEATIRIGSISPTALPNRPAAYEAVDVMILSELIPAATNPKALKALAMWVASGGILVIPTGANYRLYQNSFYDELLPVTVEGVIDMPSMNALSKLGKSPFPAGPVTVVKSTVKKDVGRVIVAEGGVPLVVERSYGSGLVIFLAFDHLSSPFKDWSGQVEFWKSIIRRPTGLPIAKSIAKNADDLYLDQNYSYYNYNPQYLLGANSLENVVAHNPSVKVPSFTSIGLFLFSYIMLLVPINYLVLKRIRRLELAWVTTPAIVVLFVMGAYVMGYTMKGSELKFRQATFIEGRSGERFARVLTAGLLFSPARRTYDLQVADSYSIAQVVPAEVKDQLPPTYIDDKLLIEDLPMAMWSSKGLESVSGMDLGGYLDADLVMLGKRIQGTITNNTAVPLQQCVIVYGQSRLDIPDLPIGGSTKVSILYDPYKDESRYAVTPQLGSLSSRLYTFSLGMAGATNAPVLLAVPDVRHKVFSVVGNEASTESVIRCAIRLRYRAGTAFRLEDSMMRRSVIKAFKAQVEGPANATGPQAGNLPVTFLNRGHLVASYQFQVPPGGKLTTLILTLQPKGISTTQSVRDIEVSVYNCSKNRYDVVKPVPQARLTNGADYIAPDGEIRVRMKQLSTKPTAVVLDLAAEGRGR